MTVTVGSIISEPRMRAVRARVALVGHHFEGMTDLMVDQLSLRTQVGPICWPVEPEKVALAMQALPDRCRQVFTLRKLYGLSHREIAAACHQDEPTVRKRISRALARLRAVMPDEEIE